MSFTNEHNWDTLEDLSLEDSSGSLDGGQGPDMDIWDEDREALLTTLLGDSLLANESSYAFPGGVVAMYDFGEGVDEFERGIFEPDSGDTLAGSTGPDMAVWSEDRLSKLNKLISDVDSSNYSSYGIPGGVIAQYDFGEGVGEFEKHLGYSATGLAVDSEGDGLSGSARMLHSDTRDVLSSRTVSGEFIHGVGPNGTGAIKGSSVDDSITSGDIILSFVPTLGGIPYEEEDLSKYSFIRYSGVEGEVTDYEGDPVYGVTVHARGAGTSTNELGEYRMRAPVGNEVSIDSLNGTVEKSFVAGENSYAVVDFQFAGVEVSVSDKDFQPVEGAPVEIGNETFTTDETGTITWTTAGIEEEYTVRVFESDELSGDIKTLGEGELVVANAGTSGSDIGDGDPLEKTELRVVDSTSSRSIKGLPARDMDSGLSTESSKSGKLSMLLVGDDFDGRKIIIGEGDARYVTERVSLDEIETSDDITDISMDRQLASNTY